MALPSCVAVERHSLCRAISNERLDSICITSWRLKTLCYFTTENITNLPPPNSKDCLLPHNLFTFQGIFTYLTYLGSHQTGRQRGEVQREQSPRLGMTRTVVPSTEVLANRKFIIYKSYTSYFEILMSQSRKHNQGSLIYSAENYSIPDKCQVLFQAQEPQL